MWMGKQLSRRAREDEPDTGAVTAAGEMLCVICDGEKRSLTVYGPGGYRWSPQVGQEVLVLKNGAVCGAVCGGTLEPGQVELCAPGGASILLDCDGKITLSGQITVDGDLTVDGLISCAGLIVGGRRVM